MRYPSEVVPILLILATSIAQATPMTFTRANELQSTELSEWPLSAHHGLPLRRRTAETNGDRIKRGLSPLTPKRPYDPSKTYQVLRPRISPAPQEAGNAYTFQRCVMNVSGGSFQGASSTYPSPQDAADYCAGGGPDTFALFYDSQTQEYSCYFDPTSYTRQACTVDNQALYSSVGDLS